MPQLMVTLVDHTPSTKEHFKVAIMHALQEFLGDILFTNQEPTVVNARWVSQSPQQADQDLVIHWVENIGASYYPTKNGQVTNSWKGRVHAHL